MGASSLLVFCGSRRLERNLPAMGKHVKQDCLYGGTRADPIVIAQAGHRSRTRKPTKSGPDQHLSADAKNMGALLDQSYSAMYDLRFDDALRLAESAKALATDDPVPWMTQAVAILFREFDRLHILRSELFGADDRFIDGPPMVWDPQSHQQFERALSGTESMAQERLKQSKDDPRALFALSLASGLRADEALP